MTKPKKEKILIVDDDRDVAELLSATFSQEGYACESAYSGAEALLSIQKNTDKPFSLILADLLMPLMDGIELMEKVQESHPEIGILVISADKNLPQAVEAMRKGALDFITKPFQSELIVPRVQKALEPLKL